MVYSDGTVAEYAIVDDQGFHRVSELKIGNSRIIQHEVFFTFGG